MVDTYTTEQAEARRKARLMAFSARQRDAGPVEPTPRAFLLDLAERLMHVPAMYGVDQGDADRLSEIAKQFPEWVDLD